MWISSMKINELAQIFIPLLLDIGDSVILLNENFSSLEFVSYIH